MGVPNNKFTNKQLLIIDSAVQVFSEKGIKRATFAEIGARVDLATTSITYYFKKKEDLATACYLRSIDRVCQIVESVVHVDSLAGRLKLLLRLLIEDHIAVQRGSKPPLMPFGELVNLSQTPYAEVLKQFMEMFKRLKTVLSSYDQSTHQESLPTASTNWYFQFLWLEYWWFEYFESRHKDRVVNHLLDVWSNGLFFSDYSFNVALADKALLQLNQIAARKEDKPVEKILVAATNLINKHGYDCASIDKICASLEITKGAVYHHFDSKEELAEAAFDRTIDIVSGVMSEVLKQDLNSRDKLFALCYTLIVKQVDGTMPLISSRVIRTISLQHREKIQNLHRKTTNEIRYLISDGVLEGLLRPVDVLITAEVVSCAINSAFELKLWLPAMEQGDFLAQYLRPTLCGWLPPEN